MFKHTSFIVASEGLFIQPAMLHFDAHYDHWIILMETFLRLKEYWSWLNTGYVEPAAEADVTVASKRLEELKLKGI